jgi:teichoic acid transport system permease protein
VGDDLKDVDDTEEPAVLGAAPTLPFRRETRAERSERRLAARSRDRGRPPAPAEAPTTLSPGTAAPEHSGVEYVFEPHTKSVPPLGQYMRDLWRRRRFVQELSRAQIQRERTRTIFGALWGILDPLLFSAIYIFLFTVIREGQRPTEFIPILIAGIILFGVATDAITRGATAITGSSNLMLNSTFPRALLPITVVYKSVIQILPVVPVYALIFWLMPTEASWSLLLMAPLFVVQIVMCVGLALMTATLVVYFQDVRNMLTYLNRLLFFTSPIIYPVTFIPDDMRSVLQWQPFFALFASYQEILGGSVPAVGQMLQATAWACGILVFGAWLFLRHERDFAVNL